MREVCVIHDFLQAFFRQCGPREGASYGISPEIMDTYVKSCGELAKALPKNEGEVHARPLIVEASQSNQTVRRQYCQYHRIGDILASFPGCRGSYDGLGMRVVAPTVWE